MMRRAVLLLLLFAGANAINSWAQPPDPPLLLPEDPEYVDVQAIGERLVRYAVSPDKAVYHFVSEYSTWIKLKELALLVSGGDPLDPAFKELQPEYEKMRPALSINVKDIQITVNKNDAKADVSLVAVNNWGAGMNWKESLSLHREDTKWGVAWRIVPGEPTIIYEPDDGFFKRIATYLAYPKQMSNLLKVKEATQQVKLLGLGLAGYLQNSNNKYTVTAETFKEQLMPYIIREDFFTAPGDGVGFQSYSLNPRLADVEANKLTNRNKTVAIYLGRDDKLDFRFDGLTIVGFADGHVEYLNAEQAKNLRWEP